MTKEINNLKVAVVGAGIYGSTIAHKLAGEGAQVTLFDKASDIMTAASGINQYRLHRGYHYPRSSDTIKSCMEATPLFESEYSAAVISHLDHYYAIAKEKSFVDASTYMSVLTEHRLPFTIEEPSHINSSSVQLVIKAEEKLYDPVKLKEILLERLKKNNVRLILNTLVVLDDLEDYDYVVVATYADSNSVFKNTNEYYREYQYELCEKIVLEIPDELKGVSTVVMDGPFMSFDPLGNTGYAVMGHVEHAIHKRSFGHHAEIPVDFLPYLNKGFINNPRISNAQKFLEEGIKYIPALYKAKHVASMYTVRTVLPKVETTDARPTIVNVVNNRVITVYSGKVGNCIIASNQVIDIISNSTARSSSTT